MPNRILREGILTSERVNQLSAHAELFYRRLMSVVDDWGRYYANPSLLRAACYPLLLDRVKEAEITKLLAECVKVGLILTYEVDSRKYLQIVDFRQQVRAQRSKFPEPPDKTADDSTCNTMDSGCIADATHMHSTCYAHAQHMKSSAHLDEDEDGDVFADGTNTLSGKPDEYCKARIALCYLNEKAGRHFREIDANLRPIYQRLKEVNDDLEGVKKMIDRMCLRWKGTEQEEYLRPETLFRKSKFHGYYDQRDLPVTPKLAEPKQIPETIEIPSLQ